MKNFIFIFSMVVLFYSNVFGQVNKYFYEFDDEGNRDSTAASLYYYMMKSENPDVFSIVFHSNQVLEDPSSYISVQDSVEIISHQAHNAFFVEEPADLIINYVSYGDSVLRREVGKYAGLGAFSYTFYDSIITESFFTTDHIMNDFFNVADRNLPIINKIVEKMVTVYNVGVPDTFTVKYLTSPYITYDADLVGGIR